MRNQTLDRLYGLLTEPFRDGSRIDLRLVVVFLAVNGLVLINAWLHDPRIGYDNNAYFAYIERLSEFHLVTLQYSREFFSPPLPFALPAMLEGIWEIGIEHAVKAAQYLNVVLSLGLTWMLLRVAQLQRARSSFRLGTLLFLGILPVYYKSFAFVRGEPLVAFFSVAILYVTQQMCVDHGFTKRRAVALGMLMGLSLLSRQWGILLFPAVYLLLAYKWIRHAELRRPISRVVAVSGLVATVIAGWFYLHLRVSQGSFTPFNRSPASRFSLSNQPSEFYFGLTPRLLARRPFRPHFANQFIPILYSEIWGDYWGFFSVASIDTRSENHLNGRWLAAILDTGSRPDWFETNYDEMVPYLGNVNLVSFLPSLLAVGAMSWAAVDILRWWRRGRSLEPTKEAHAFWLVAIASVMVGYFWFLIMYPSLGKGDTIKATYILQVFPIVSLLVGTALEMIRPRSELAFRLILAGLVLVAVHNLSAMVSHY